MCPPERGKGIQGFKTRGCGSGVNSDPDTEDSESQRERQYWAAREEKDRPAGQSNLSS